MSAPSTDALATFTLTAQQWSKRHVHIDVFKSQGSACAVRAQAALPLTAAKLFALFTHPASPAVFRSVDCCAFHAVEEDNGQGRVTLRLEHESACQFLWWSGEVRTPMLVQQDTLARRLRFELDPEVECSHLAAMHGAWSVAGAGASQAGWHLLTLDWYIQPRGIPAVMAGAVRSYAAAKARQAFEDLFTECQHIAAGRPTLWLADASTCEAKTSIGGDLMSSASGLAAAGGICKADPASVLQQISGSSADSSSCRQRSRADVARSAAAAPASHPLRLRRAYSRQATGGTPGKQAGGPHALARFKQGCSALQGWLLLPLQLLQQLYAAASKIIAVQA